MRRVAGRKSDIEDAQWIQTLHSYGLLESSFRPQAELIALRTLLRHRSQLIEHRSPHIQHMQKALLQMNVQLSQAVSDVTGITGQAIICAILAGERDPKKLAALREPGCKKSEEEIGKALTGTWREEHLFVLKQSMEMYTFYTEQVRACDEEIERVYGETRPDWDAGEVQPLSKRKRNSHSKNKPQNAESIREHLKRISRVDLSVIDGFGVSLAQTVIMECGTDMGKFPSEKHFCSWLGLAPKHEISGGKVLKNKTLKTKNRAGQAFRMAAQSVKQAGLCVRGHVPANASQAGSGASDGSHGARHGAGGVPDVEVPGGIRDDQRGRIREEVQRTATQIHEEESQKTRLPTRATRSSLRAIAWNEKRRPQVENACFAFNCY